MKHYILGDIIDEISERENNPSTSGYERFVGLEHYVSGDVEIKKYGSTLNLNSAMKVFKSGDILVARRNVYLKRASVVYFDGLTSGDSIVLRAKDETVGRILPFILNTSEFWEYADQYSDGTMSKRLSPKMLKSYEFDLPDDEELPRLADLLWAAVDTKTAYEELLIKTDELVKSQFIEMFGDPYINDKGWETREFAKLCSAIGDGLHGTPEYDDNGPYPFINGNNLRENKIEITSETRKVGSEMYDKYFIELDETTVLLSINGTLGKTALYDGEEVILGKSACYSKVGPLLDREFVLAVFLSDAFQQYMQDNCTGTTIKNFGLKALRNYPMIVPPMEEQKRYVEFMRQSDKSKLELQQAIASTDNLMKAILFSNLEDKEG